MKKLFKFSCAIVLFMAVLCVNVSINANKEAEDTNLIGFTSEANARFECPQATLSWNNNGLCDYLFGRCHVPVTILLYDEGDCDPFLHFLQ